MDCQISMNIRMLLIQLPARTDSHENKEWASLKGTVDTYRIVIHAQMLVLLLISAAIKWYRILYRKILYRKKVELSIFILQDLCCKLTSPPSAPTDHVTSCLPIPTPPPRPWTLIRRGPARRLGLGEDGVARPRLLLWHHHLRRHYRHRQRGLHPPRKPEPSKARGREPAQGGGR